MSSFHTVFVYGTLKRDEPNHNWLSDSHNGKSTFKGKATTQEKYPLVIASRYNIPYLINAAGQGHHVEGEVYEVDDTMLSALDRLEDHPKYYERKKNFVKMSESGTVVEAWIYLLHKFKPHLLTLPFLTSYECEGDHGLSYMARYLRKNPGPEYWSDVKEEAFY